MTCSKRTTTRANVFLWQLCNSAGISVSKELSGYEAGKKDRVGDIVLHLFDQGRESLLM